MRIIPAIDIINGKCVRLQKGDYTTKIVYNDNPLEVAQEFEKNSIKYLHLVDLDGAKSNKILNIKILDSIASKTNLKIDFGGGLKTDGDVKRAFDSGATQISCGSVALENPNLFLKWVQTYGPKKVLLGADFRNRNVAIQGWLKKSKTDVIDYLIEYEKLGVRTAICTDISKDGMLQGTSNKLYKEILENTSLNLIASGGVSSLEDLKELDQIGCEGVVIGKAIYEGKITLKQLSELC